MGGQRPAPWDRLGRGPMPSSVAVFARPKAPRSRFRLGIGDNPLKRLVSGKEINLDFLQKNLDFLQPGLEFLQCGQDGRPRPGLSAPAAGLTGAEKSRMTRRSSYPCRRLQPLASRSKTRLIKGRVSHHRNPVIAKTGAAAKSNPTDGHSRSRRHPRLFRDLSPTKRITIESRQRYPYGASGDVSVAFPAPTRSKTWSRRRASNSSARTP